jgi:processive 1,2-diacylglycerol beta-glucosyltransferase
MPVKNGKRTKVLILSVSAGAGHVRAAQALEASLGRWYENVDAVHMDIMELVPPFFRKVYTDSYIKIVEKYPALWGYLYNKADQEKADSALNKFRIAVESLNTQKLRSVLREINPDHVICTHFLPAQLLSHKIEKGTFTKPVWVVVTDFDVHTLWIHPRMSGYFAAHDEVAWRMAARGIPREVIHVTGIPVMPQFSDPFSRKECAVEFGLNPDKKTILMMSGGVGIGGIEILAEMLLTLNYDFQIVALAGRNEALLKYLNEIAAAHPGRLFPLGFTRVVERVMAASDLAITKPGGLTTSECLAIGLPLIIVSPIPGQEERNADFLLENGAALKACDGGALNYRVSMLLNDPARLEELKKNTKRLGKPEAARTILDTILAEPETMVPVNGSA